MGDPGRGTPDAPGSLPSKVGDGLQFVSALLAPANSSARLCQASAPTNPVPRTQIASTCSSRLRENRSPVSLARRGAATPGHAAAPSAIAITSGPIRNAWPN